MRLQTLTFTTCRQSPSPSPPPSFFPTCSYLFPYLFILVHTCSYFVLGLSRSFSYLFLLPLQLSRLHPPYLLQPSPKARLYPPYPRLCLSVSARGRACRRVRPLNRWKRRASSVYAYVCLCLPASACVCPRLSMSTCVCLCLPMSA